MEDRMMNDKKQMLSERSVMFGGGTVDNVLTEGVGAWFELLFTGKSDHELDEIEDDIKECRTTTQKSAILKRIDLNIERAEDAVRSSEGQITGRDFGTFMLGSMLNLPVGALSTVIRRNNIKFNAANGKLKAYQTRLLGLKKKAEAIKV
jgi:hypothetical protein